MKKILEDLGVDNHNQSPQKKGFEYLLYNLNILNDIQKYWQSLEVKKKLPQGGYRFVSLRSNSEGYTLTIFVNNAAIESKFTNYLPTIIKELSPFSITQLNIKIRNN